MIFMGKKDKKPAEAAQPTPLALQPTESEEAARIATLRVLTNQARWHLERLKEIETQIKEKGGSAKIVAHVEFVYANVYTNVYGGMVASPPTFFIESNYSAKL